MSSPPTARHNIKYNFVVPFGETLSDSNEKYVDLLHVPQRKGKYFKENLILQVSLGRVLQSSYYGALATTRATAKSIRVRPSSTLMRFRLKTHTLRCV